MSSLMKTFRAQPSPNRRAAFGLRRTFQTEQVVENLTVRNNVAAALDNLPTGGRVRHDLIGEALDYVGLNRQAERIGAVLNASERRLVEIARCIVAKPRLVMMDEPGAGLSQGESDHLRDVIVGIPEFCGAQVLLVDHDVDLISATCQETLVLDFGSKIAFGVTAEVLKDPKVRAAYLGTMRHDERFVGSRRIGRAQRQADHPRRRHRNRARQDHGAARRQRRG
jgi:branched-chain amino acid transport system ATP-binding protein